MSDQSDKQNEDREKQRKLELSQWHTDLKWLMGHDGGKRIIRHLMAQSSRQPFAVDERVTCYNLGRQELIRGFTDALKDADFGLYQITERFIQDKKP